MSANLTGLFERLISQKLQKFTNDALTRDTLFKMYGEIHEAIMIIFNRCEFELAETSKEYVISSFFGALTINGKEDMFVHHELAKTDVTKLPVHDIRLLSKLFANSMMEEKLESELKRRT